MYDIYEGASVIIVPGGLSRLTRGDDQTTWMDRVWTLQEAIAAPSSEVEVLFSYDPSLPFEQYMAKPPFIKYQVKRPEDENKHNFILAGSTCALVSLEDVLTMIKYSHELPFGFRKVQAQALLHSRFGEGSSGRRNGQAVWQSVLMRTSSRPVDMIFSVMSFFNVSLDPSQFEADDRVGATIALAQQILKQAQSGSGADLRNHWLGALYFLDPSPNISTFPSFPETSVGGSAYIVCADGKRRLVADIMERYIAQIKGICEVNLLADDSQDPGGVDYLGCYTFKARFVLPLTSTGIFRPLPENSGLSAETNWAKGDPIIAADGSEWCIHQTFSTSSSASLEAAEAVGIYLGQHLTHDVFLIAKATDCSKARWRRTSYSVLVRGWKDWEKERFDQQGWFPYVICGKYISIE